MKALNDRQWLVLEHLARYTFLTSEQLVMLGVAPQIQNVRDRYLRPLIKYSLVDSAQFHEGQSRLPRIHFLTKAGAELVGEEMQIGSVYYPIGKVQFTRDYHHRIDTINFLIKLHLWADGNGANVEFADAYYHVEGSQRISQLIRRTQVSCQNQIVVPDLNFMLMMKDREQRLFTVEIHLQPKASRIVEQLKPHAEIIRHNLLSNKYSHLSSHRVLNVFSHPRTMESVMKELLKDPVFKDVSEHYLFAQLSSVQKDFSQAWHHLDGSKSPLFL